MVELFRALIHRPRLAAFLLGLTIAFYLHFPAFVNPYRFNEDWRQAPHWTNPAGHSFRRGDFLYEYAEFNTPPLNNTIYPLLSYLGGAILWGKILAVLYHGLTVLAIFVTARSLSTDRKVGDLSGAAAALVYTFFPTQFYWFSGAYGHALMPLFCCLALLIIHRKRYWLALPLMAFEAVAYPSAAVFTGAYFLIEAILSDYRWIFQKDFWTRKALPLLVAAVAGFLVLSVKYLEPHPEYGELAGWKEISANWIAYTSKGRYPVLPVRSVWRVLGREWGDIFHVAVFLVALLVLKRDALRIPRPLLALLAASLGVYLAAYLFLMKLYIPNRYVRYPLPVFTAVLSGLWLGRAGAALGVKTVRVRIGAVALALLGFLVFGHKARAGMATKVYDRVELYRTIRSLPGRPLIISHPDIGDEIPLMTGRSILVSEEFAHPWWSEVWDTMTVRIHDFFRMYYATDTPTVAAFFERYGGDALIVDRRHFRRKYLRRGKFLFEPFNTWVRDNLSPGRESLVRRIPEEYRLYDGRRCFLVTKEALFAFLATVPGDTGAVASRTEEDEKGRGTVRTREQRGRPPKHAEGLDTPPPAVTEKSGDVYDDF
ncbi:MAG: hypothetical protein D6679_09075 [Candidatus Hydrogenedentota bacterium]|nr:MAG: hypothetical protein D6679_09075 [Candidatus Hydrogenedentota bacterium]